MSIISNFIPLTLNPLQSFRQWAHKHLGEDMAHMNIRSNTHKLQLLYAPFTNEKIGESIEQVREFEVIPMFWKVPKSLTGI